MANFMQAFEDQRENYLAHYGKKGMKWGVITSEYEPVGDDDDEAEFERRMSGGGMRWGGVGESEEARAQRIRAEMAQEKAQSQSEYSQQDQESMQQSADAIRQADAESVKDKRKRIVKNIVKGVAIGAIVAGIAAGAVKGYAKKQTGEKQDLATSIGIVGQKFRSTPGHIGDAVKKGFNMDTGSVKAANEAERIRKRDERVQAFKNAAGKVGQAVGSAVGKAGQAVGTAAGNAKKNFEARSQAAEELRKSIAESKNMNIRFPQGQGRFGSGTGKMDFGSIREEAEKSRPIGNMQFGSWADKSRTKKIDPELLRNRYNSRRGYYETPRSRIYRG